MSSKGSLSYSTKENCWVISLDDGNIFDLSKTWLLDVDVNLSGYYSPCVIDLESEDVSFAYSGFHLDRCYDYDIILYHPVRSPEERTDHFDEEFNDVPF